MKKLAIRTSVMWPTRQRVSRLWGDSNLQQQADFISESKKMLCTFKLIETVWGVVRNEIRSAIRKSDELFGGWYFLYNV